MFWVHLFCSPFASQNVLYSEKNRKQDSVLHNRVHYQPFIFLQPKTKITDKYIYMYIYVYVSICLVWFPKDHKCNHTLI